MNLLETNKKYCVICVKTNTFFECNELIFEFSGPTYKECYQQFTQLKTKQGIKKLLGNII